VGDTWWALFAGEEIGRGGGAAVAHAVVADRGGEARTDGGWTLEGGDEADWWLLGLLRSIYFFLLVSWSWAFNGPSPFKLRRACSPVRM